MYKSVVYKGEDLLGEVEIYPRNQNQNQNEEIRISHMSQPSERCPPLAVLHTIASNGVFFKMESSNSHSQDSPLSLLHSSCLKENKTAVVSLGLEELHLVALYSRNNERQYPCFWGFIVAPGLYDSCLVMLNIRCLGIVFDLDETLVVANTMRSFEDRIEALQRKINMEVDPQRISGMLAEVKRYQDDKVTLKQYAENDQVVENGKLIKIQSEVVPALSDNHQPIIRPIIRLPEKNIILTRINPLIRDTSVLVRLRPAWEDLRGYLIARGRKRFEVYVCTMAERDYALEMWRLLDPDLNLINSKDLLDRIVCVKSGLRKSLFNVFQSGSCHPKMALVIDDRLKVWDEKDQPRVHVVPAFAPYYAPQAEANNTIPVLCMARNVACNVRGGFFKDFDDGLLQRISEVSYDDDFKDILSPPDVSNYLVSEDDASTNMNKEPLPFDGMADAEVERRLKDAISASTVASVDPRIALLHQSTTSSSGPALVQSSQGTTGLFPQATSMLKPSVHVSPLEPTLQSSPAREEGEVPESELDPDTRRRLLILQHGHDSRGQALSEPPVPVRPPPTQVSAPQAQQSRGNWFPVEEDRNRAIPKEFTSIPEATQIDKIRPQTSSFFPKVENSVQGDRFIQNNLILSKETNYRDDRLRLNQRLPNFPSYSGEEAPLGRLNSMNRNSDFENGRDVPYAETPAGRLLDIAMKCGTKVEFRPALAASMHLQFTMEVWFAGEKVGEGSGRTRREARRLAAENSLKNLANKYLSLANSDHNTMHGDGNKYRNAIDYGFINDVSSIGHQPHKEATLSFSNALDPSKFPDPRLEGSNRMMGSISALKELCTMEGLDVVFQAQPLSANSNQKDEVYAQVEIDGQVLGKGIGLTWDEAKMQASENALVTLRSMLAQYNQRRQGSPRSSFQGMPNKRLKQEFPRSLQRMPSARYPKNAAPVP